jgi:hypothetical protein
VRIYACELAQSIIDGFRDVLSGLTLGIRSSNQVAVVVGETKGLSVAKARAERADAVRRDAEVDVIGTVRSSTQETFGNAASSTA